MSLVSATTLMSLTEKFLLKSLPIFLPIVVVWALCHERRILNCGLPLSAEGLADAARMGVRFPEKVRVMQVERIPLLNGWMAKMISCVIPDVSSSTVGLSLGYGIYVRTHLGNNRHLIAHECVHTGQYERCGGVSPFLRAYLGECFEYGYPNGPFEQEAILRSMEVLDWLLAAIISVDSFARSVSVTDGSATQTKRVCSSPGYGDAYSNGRVVCTSLTSRSAILLG